MYLTQKKTRFVRSEACEKSLQELKDRITFSPVLTLQDGNDVFVVFFYSSRVGLSFVLMKQGKVMIAYASRKHKTHQKHYTTMILNYWS